MPQVSKQRMHIGIDDTDSTRKGCTTYVAALLVEELEKLNVAFVDYPGLIRLNPNVPWKTRGNGALCLRIEHDSVQEQAIKEVVVQLVEEHSDLVWKGTDPGVVFLKAKEVPADFAKFARKTTTGIVTLKEALRLIKKYHGEAFGYNTQRGIIGATAAIGETLQQDHTYELITYRVKANIGTKRKVDRQSIFQMDQVLQPYTFNNIDTEKPRIIITPRGNDPILFGIRGENPETVKQAFDMVKPLEPIERWVIFRSNQGTDAHLVKATKLSQLQPYGSIIAKGTVSRQPRVVPVRHVVFAIKDETAEVDCAAYEPTGTLRKVARELRVGDEIEVYGAVRRPAHGRALTVNLEKINILNLFRETVLQNPLCPTCGKRLKSMGKGQGLRCEKCKSRFPELTKLAIPVERKIEPGLYVTSTRSQRHLTKPLRRYGLEKHIAPPPMPAKPWHS